MKSEEHYHAVALMERIEMAKARWPELEWFHAIPNGGHRSKASAGKAKAEGQKAGVPDYSLPVRRGACPGLVLELKVGKNKPSKDQERWLAHYRSQGWEVVVAYGWEAAWDHVHAYLLRT